MKALFLSAAVLVLGSGVAFADAQGDAAATVRDAMSKVENMVAAKDKALGAGESKLALPVEAKADILGSDGVKLGEAVFTQGTIGVLATITVKGLPPGKHGMHIHSKGTCDHHDHFKSASGHIDPDEKAHGYLNPDGPEKGDLPNIIIHADGSAALELFMPQLDVAGGKAALLDADGSALMIHDAPDDHITQPIGGSGARIACGVIHAQ